MTLPSRARRVLRSIRQAIPSGVVLGRRSSGVGPAEFIPLDEATLAQLDAISATRGTILYRGATEWEALAPGTAGHVLHTDGAGADPYWAVDDAGGSSTFSGALVERTSNATGLTFPYFVEWQNAARDTDSFFNVLNPTRLTIPAGISKVRLKASVVLEAASQSGSLSASFRKNGATVLGSSLVNYREGATGFNNNTIVGFTAVLDVVQNDYFEIRINKSGMTSVNEVLTNDSTWMEIEKVE